MSAKFPMIIKRHLFSSIIEEKDDFLNMEKEKKDINVGVKIPRSVFELLKIRAERKKEKLMLGKEIYELAMIGIQLEINPIVDKVQSEKEKRALEVLDKIKRVIKEEGV